MAIIQKTLFPENLEKYNTFVNDTDTNSKYFKITELPDTLTGGKNAFLIQGSQYLVPDTLIKIEIKDSKGNIIYHEPGEGYFSSSLNDESGKPIITEYYEGVSKVVAVYVYPNTTFGPATITILGEVSSYDNNGLLTPIPLDWEGQYNVKWQKQVNINPALANTTKIRFYKRPAAKITEILNPIYKIENDLKVASAVTQSFANIKLSNLETFAGDVKRVKVFRTSTGDISDYDLIQDILVESKELLISYGLSGSVIGNTGIFTSEVLKNQWNSGSLNATLNSTRVEAGVRLTGSGNFKYTQSLDLKSTNAYELNLDAFYSSSTNSNLGVYLNYISQSTTFSSSITTLIGTQPTKNLLDTVIPFKIDRDYPTAFLYFSQSQGEWHIGNVSLKLSQDTAFSPDEIGFITTMPTVLGNETFNFKFEFYDVNNNYVPVAVTQSATFNGGNTNIGGTILLINSSASSSLADLNRVSSSISGTVTLASASISGTLGTISGSISGSLTNISSSVSGTITTLSGSVSRSVALNLSSSLSKTQQLANGQFSGSFIGSDVIYSPTIGGQQGYISSLFKVGTAPSIYLDARQSPRKIFIGGAIPSGDTEYSGAYNNTNTAVYLDSGGKFSLKDKLVWNGTSLSINGDITATSLTLSGFSLAKGDVGLGNVENLSAANQAKTGIEAAITIGSGGIAMLNGGFIRGGQTDYNTGTGFFLGYSGTKYKFSIGNASTKGIIWDGDDLSIGGGVTIGSTLASTVVSNASSALTNAATAQSTADGKITAGGAAGDVNSNTTTINGGKIRTGIIESTGYAYSSGNFSTTGTQINLDNGLIRSKNFGISTAGDAYFKGDITGAGGTFSGTVRIGAVDLTEANTLNSNVSSGNVTGALGYTPPTTTQVNDADKSGGSVGGWAITSTQIQGGSPAGGGDGSYTSQGIRLGSSGWISSKNFYISSAGDAFFKGNVTATGGTFNNVSVGSGGVTFAGGNGKLTDTGLYLNGQLTVAGGGGIDFGTSGFFTTIRQDAIFSPYMRVYGDAIHTKPLYGSGNAAIGLTIDGSNGIDCGGYLFVGSMQTDGSPGTNYAVKRATARGELFQSSSTRKRKNIYGHWKEDGVLNAIKNVPVERFKYKNWPDEEVETFGLIAEDLHNNGFWQSVIYESNDSGSAIYEEEKVDGIDYDKVTSILWKAVQELTTKIETLEARISGSI